MWTDTSASARADAPPDLRGRAASAQAPTPVVADLVRPLVRSGPWWLASPLRALWELPRPPWWLALGAAAAAWASLFSVILVTDTDAETGTHSP